MVVMKTFTSETSQDILEVYFHQKSHNAFFTLKQIDNAVESTRLVTQLITFVKQYDIKWIVLKLDFIFKIPENTVWFKNKYNSNIHIHIEDFEKFYLQNLLQLIKLSNVYITSDGEDKDGWIKVMDPKKEKRLKMNQLNKEVNGMLSSSG